MSANFHPLRLPRLIGLTITLLVACSILPLSAAVSFSKQIAPILAENCTACHGPKKAKGSYRVDSFNRAMKAGDTGNAMVDLESIEDGELFYRIATDDEDDRMPLDGDPLPAEQINLIKQWIKEGARYDAADPDAPLASIVPPAVHPTPPAKYPQSIPVTALEFSPNGKELFAAGYHELTVWDPSTGNLLRRIQQQGQRTYAIDIHPDGNVLAAASGTPGRLGELRLFNAQSGKLLQVLLATSDIVLDSAFSPDGHHLLAGTSEGKLHVFNTRNYETVQINSSHSDWITAVAWNQDGSRFASASRDKTAKVFEFKTGQRISTYAGHSEPVRGIAFHPNGKELYTSSSDHHLHLWNSANGKKSKTVLTAPAELYKLTSGTNSIVAIGAHQQATLLNSADQKRIKDFTGHEDWVLAAGLDEAGGYLATGDFNGGIIVWSATDGSKRASWTASP